MTPRLGQSCKDTFEDKNIPERGGFLKFLNTRAEKIAHLSQLKNLQITKSDFPRQIAEHR